MAKGASLSGFPEWLPQERVVEQGIIDTLRQVFELHGFIGIETRAVEPGSSLLKKGETSKEIYLLSRLQEVGHESDTPIDKRLGLHFDLTVPLSRYVVEKSGSLVFPFKRWQIQKVWRGERPQEGRFREFVQADIDIVGNGTLPEHYEIELPLVMVDALEKMKKFGLSSATVHVNNRMLSQGFYTAIGLTDIEEILRQVDKLDKIGEDAVRDLLIQECHATEQQAQACLDLAQIMTEDASDLHQRCEELCDKYEITSHNDGWNIFQQGLNVVCDIITRSAVIRPGSVVADLKIARGLDYYTGTVYETFLDDAQELGSVCSGGRYDNLAQTGKKKYPGVGMSIGVSRLLAYLLNTVGAKANRISPATVMVAVWDEDCRDVSNQIADMLRTRGINTDVSPTSAKIGKQIKYADNLGIPYVWFPPQPASGDDEELTGNQVKNIITGLQQDANAVSWMPDTVYSQQAIAVTDTN